MATLIEMAEACAYIADTYAPVVAEKVATVGTKNEAVASAVRRLEIYRAAATFLRRLAALTEDDWRVIAKANWDATDGNAHARFDQLWARGIDAGGFDNRKYLCEPAKATVAALLERLK